MKRTIAAAIILALLLSLTLPAMAFAKRGGVPANSNGRGHARDIAGAEQGTASSESDTFVEPAPGPAPAPVPGKGKAKAHGKAEKAADGAADPTGDDGDSPAPSWETTPTGLENALSRVRANLERMQAEFDAGTRKNVPPGLQRVVAKFMAWLGLGAPDGADDAPDGGEAVGGEEPADDGSVAADEGGTDEEAVGDEEGGPPADPGPVAQPEFGILWLLTR